MYISGYQIVQSEDRRSQKFLAGEVIRSRWWVRQRSYMGRLTGARPGSECIVRCDCERHEISIICLGRRVSVGTNQLEGIERNLLTKWSLKLTWIV